MSTSVAIDHIIVLLPYKDIISPPKWLTDYFNISPGGRHGDGKTENRLIILQDGSYIELIAFIDDDADRRAGHWWDKEYGIVDYALTTAGRFSLDIRDRLDATKTGITYAIPQHGERTRPDGVQMEWEVTFPEGVERGVVPFWCHDVTPRDRRVPKGNTTHPSGVLGVAAVTVKLPKAQTQQIDRALAAIVNAEANAVQHQVAAPETVPGTKAPYLEVQEGGEHRIELSLQVSANSSCQDIVQRVGNGLVSIRFVTV